MDRARLEAQENTLVLHQASNFGSNPRVSAHTRTIQVYVNVLEPLSLKWLSQPRGKPQQFLMVASSSDRNQ